MPQPLPLPYPLPFPGPITPQQPPQPQPTNLKIDGNKRIYTTKGGYKVVYDPKKHEVHIYDPKGKEITKVWGDPHVKEADGSQWQWKNKNVTLILPDGTKLSMHANKANGVVTGLDIYAPGYTERVSMNDKGQVAVSHNVLANYYHDKMTADGDTFVTTNNGKDWHVIYRENAPGKIETNLTDRDAKKAENFHQRIENLVDAARRKKGKTILGGVLGAILGTLIAPGVGTVLGGLLGGYLGTRV